MNHESEVLVKLRGYFALLALFVLLGFSALLYVRWYVLPLENTETVRVEIPAGVPLQTVAAHLQQTGVLPHPADLVWFARVRGDGGKIRAGEYDIPAGSTINSLLSLLISGKVVKHSLTIVEGWTFGQMMTAIRQEPNLRHTLMDASPRMVMERLGHTGWPEGMFFPDTYDFPRGITDVEFLRRAYLHMQTQLQQAWENRASALPLATPYDALILASIVEKETALADERPKIAGVFERRLKRGMRLQADPTIIYGLGKNYTGDITFADLREDTPYNTYTRNGLPPTPICLPGLASIKAVLHPATGNALYFVARGDGSHVFSATLEEHEKAVKKYQLKGRGK